ncbi:MAG: YceI family protein [Solirubrobacterales bacterium]|nr:YceI family protein [Solirubrobacterales bacterium]
MSIEAGTHKLGPSNGSLQVKTGKEGAAAKMGHNLVLGVNSWEATVEGGDSPSISLTADPESVEVISGEGGAKPLSDKDKGEIKKSITKKVLGGSQITFRSTSVEDNGAQMLAKGDLSIAGKSNSVSVPLSVSGGKISGSLSLSQKDFAIKQFSTMMGALKVSDQVEVVFEGQV